MSESLSDIAGSALKLLSESFVFRKLGICYDYYCAPNAIPNPLLPHAKDIKQGLPNPAGLGSGMADCALNNALLCDAFSTRLEIGFGTAEDDKVFDRIIGGIIRLATIAPKNSVIRGLSPDGKSYYPQSGHAAALYWAFSAWRAATTPAVASESQGKIRNICQHWMENLEQNGFVLPNNDPALTAADWVGGILKPALLAVAFALSGNEKWRALALAELRLSDAAPERLPDSAGRAENLFAMQLSLYLLREILGTDRPTPAHADEPSTEKTAAAVANDFGNTLTAPMTVLADAAAKILAKYPELALNTLDDRPELDWHAVKEDGALPWNRIIAENAGIADPALAMLTILWAADAATVQRHAPQIQEFLRFVPWEKVWLGRALTAAALGHALGVARGLWEENLREYQLAFDGKSSLVERFLDPAYDENNPDKSGPTEAAPRKEIEIYYGGNANNEKRKGGHGHGHNRPGKGNKQPNPNAVGNGHNRPAASGAPNPAPAGAGTPPGGNPSTPNANGDNPNRHGGRNKRSRRHGKNRGKPQNNQNGEPQVPLKEFLEKRRENGNPQPPATNA